VNGSTSMTITGWIYPYEVPLPNSNVKYVIIGEKDFGFNFSIFEDLLFFGFWSDSIEQWYWAGAENSQIERQISQNRWHFVAITYDQTYLKIYLNGELNRIHEIYSTIDSNNSKLFIGSSNGIDDVFNGKIDDVQIFNRALSDKEIVNLFN